MNSVCKILSSRWAAAAAIAACSIAAAAAQTPAPDFYGASALVGARTITVHVVSGRWGTNTRPGPEEIANYDVQYRAPGRIRIVNDGSQALFVSDGRVRQECDYDRQMYFHALVASSPAAPAKYGLGNYRRVHMDYLQDPSRPFGTDPDNVSAENVALNGRTALLTTAVFGKPGREMTRLWVDPATHLPLRIADYTATEDGAWAPRDQADYSHWALNSGGDAGRFQLTAPSGFREVDLDAAAPAAQSAPAPAPAADSLAAGSIAPDFTALNRDGKPVRLSDYRGKLVLLDFWATWCVPCKASMPHLEAVYQKTRDKGVVVLALCVDDQADAFKKFVAENFSSTYHFTPLLDPALDHVGKGIPDRLYGVHEFPSEFLIGRSGEILRRIVSYRGANDHRVEEALASAGVDVGATADVAAAPARPVGPSESAPHAPYGEAAGQVVSMLTPVNTMQVRVVTRQWGVMRQAGPKTIAKFDVSFTRAYKMRVQDASTGAVIVMTDTDVSEYDPGSGEYFHADNDPRRLPHARLFKNYYAAWPQLLRVPSDPFPGAPVDIVTTKSYLDGRLCQLTTALYNPSMPAYVKLWTASATGLPLRIEEYFDDDGNPRMVLQTDFLNWRINQPIDDSVYAFVPPAQAKVVDTGNAQRGAAAPDFTALDASGKPVRLSDYRGKVVVLDFWATWCVPCREAMPGLEKLYQQYKDKGVAVLAVCVYDNPDRYKAFVKQNFGGAYHYTALFDPAGKDTSKSIAGVKYNVFSIPAMLIIGRSGEVIANLGPSTGGIDALADALAKATGSAVATN